MNDITRELINSADEKYKAFHSSLVPNIDKSTLLGVRAPICKAIAKKYASTAQGKAFLADLPHSYYDENIVHGYMLGFLRCDSLIEYIRAFLPCMDNWGVVDCTVSNLKSFFKKPDDVYDFVLECLSSSEEYTIRFGIVSLLCYYLDDVHAQMAIGQVKKIHSDKFYVKMAQAWFFATALTKHYELTLPVIEARELDVWVHNKSIQKARESLRVPREHKDYLNSLKEKK